MTTTNAFATPKMRRTAPYPYRPPSRTLRGFLCTALLMALLVGCLHLLVPVEHAIFPGRGLSDTSFASLTLILGLPHVIIGFLFSASSPCTANSRSRRAMLVAALIGILEMSVISICNTQNGRHL
jgi:hypothetical protein